MTNLRVEYLGAFFVALLLRAIYLQGAWYSNELIDFPIVDAGVYLQWAKDILAGDLLWPESSNYTPVYPLYLASWLSVLGDRTFTVFLMFHLIGAAQAVVVGLIAEEVWGWRQGLVAAFLAATYWPFVVFEASFYAEAFALWTASVGLLLAVRFRRTESFTSLLVAGLFLGLAGLARANLLLCLPVLGCWFALESNRDHAQRTTDKRTASGLRRGWIAARPALALALPVVLLAAPIVAWNKQVTGRAIVRSQGGLTFFLGSNPDFGGLVVRPGVEWRDLTIEPLRAERTTSRDREAYWNERTVEVIKSRPMDWLALQWRKLSMHFGAFEVSQEIDVSIFRQSSPILSLPLWPGFGFIMPLALAGIAVSLRRKERQAIPLLLFALCYAASLLPFQAAARYRLPLLLALIPLAAHLLVWAWDRARAGEWRVWKEWLPVALVLAVSFALVLPDYTDLRGRNRVRHEHFVAKKYYERGDIDKALLKFAEAASLDADDADSPLWIGLVRSERGEFALARAGFEESRRRYLPNPESLLGLARVAMMQEDYEAAREQMGLALLEWPHSLPGLRLLKEIAIRQEDWEAVHGVLIELRAYNSVEASELFQLGAVSEQFGDLESAMSAHHQILGNPLYEPLDRARALFTIGVLAWRYAGDAATAVEAWQPLAASGDSLFGPLSAYLIGDLDAAQLSERVPERGAGGQFSRYVRGLQAWMTGDAELAREHLQAIVDQRNAASLARSAQTAPEFWALADLEAL